MFFISTELTVCSWSSLWRSKSGILTATTELFLVVYCFFCRLLPCFCARFLPCFVDFITVYASFASLSPSLCSAVFFPWLPLGLHACVLSLFYSEMFLALPHKRGVCTVPFPWLHLVGILILDL